MSIVQPGTDNFTEDSTGTPIDQATKQNQTNGT